MSSSPCYVVNPTDYREPIIGQTGFASLAPKTVIEVFQETKEKFPHETALAFKLNTKDDHYIRINYHEYWEKCILFAKALIHLDIDPLHIVNIIGFNSPEWMISYMGSILAGCIPAGVYTTNSPETCRYISQHSKAKLIAVEGNKQLAKYIHCSTEVPMVKAILVWGDDEIDYEVAANCGVVVYDWNKFMALGNDISHDELDQRWALIKPGNCASLIYTSGTTGPPKAVMISHDNLTWTAKNIADHYMDLNHNDRIVSFLPLSHIAAQLIDIHCIIYIGGSVWFAQPDALKGSLVTTMREVRPTFFFGVPRIWEKMQEKLQKIQTVTWYTKYLSQSAMYFGKEKSAMNQFGGSGGAPWGFSCAHFMVLKKIKEALGLDKCKGCFTAAAPIAPETLWYFASLDIPVYEVFGQSECTGPHTVSAAKCWKIGTCGRPIRGTESKVDANNGELCYRGRHIFMGYMYMEEESKDSFDKDGYFKSGDIAEFDDNDDPEIPRPSGFLTITGRIKDLIVTAGGENVAPTIIESTFLKLCDAVSNCFVIGDKRKYLTMLVALKVEHHGDTQKDELAKDVLDVCKQIGSNSTTYSEVKEDEVWTKYIDEKLKELNKFATSNAQKVQKWKWLPHDFSEQTGELTPTMKVKRSAVAEQYRDIINTMYES